MRGARAGLTLLNPRDWVYSLSLLVPFVIYNLTLKAASVFSQPGLSLTFDLIQSDIFFNLGYVLLWIGLFALARRRGPLRWAVILLFHLVTILVVIVTTCAYQYFKQTGIVLDYGIIALWLPDLKEVAPVLAYGVPLSAWLLLFAALLYAALGPWLVTRAVGRWRGRSPVGALEISFLGSVGLWLLGIGLVSLSPMIGYSSIATSRSFAMAPFVNVVLTGFEEAGTTTDNASAADTAVPAVESPAAHASLVQTSRTQKRNVVLIHLESTRAGATTPYNNSLATTPFLEELAENSLLAERDYTIVPHTSKASVSVNCGIDPHIVQPTTEANPGGIPNPCLADLLKEQGYNTVFFQSSTEDFENFADLVKNFGYEEYYPLESMDADGYQQTNYFGKEDDIMLKPSEDWLKDHEDKPFLAEYLTGTGHHDYQCLDTSHGSENFAQNDLINHYLNCMRLQDIFVKNLIDQYKKLGLYDNTIFVLYGDHGEGFGEHGRFQHDDTIYQEGLKVPLIIHAPGLLKGGARVDELTNHTDILPTVLDLLGYKVSGGEYPGYSLLRPIPQDRTLRFSCFHEEQCMASIQGNKKYIYHYGNFPHEVFDLSKDPLEKNNLADEYSKEELDKLRADLLAWRSSVNAMYRPI